MLSNKVSASELSRKFIKSALLVGLALGGRWGELKKNVSNQGFFFPEMEGADVKGSTAGLLIHCKKKKNFVPSNTFI